VPARKLLLLDVYALVYRAFFALPPLTTSTGAAVNAVYGFERMLARVLSSEKPSHAVACFDAGIPAERLAAMPAYKAHRPDMPDELRSQFPLVRKVLAAYGVPQVEVEGEEADDCIATLATRASSESFASVIVSGDLDLLQLVDAHCTVLVPKRGIADMLRYNEAAVFERYGLHPSQLADYRGLKGDPSDNLSGVPGIGEKTAAKLIAQYGTLEEVLAHAREVKPDRIGALLVEHADLARRCRDVSLAKRTLAIALTWDESAYRTPDAERLAAIYREFEFRGLLGRAEGRGDLKPEESLAGGAAAPASASPAARGSSLPQWRHVLAATPEEARRVLARAASQLQIAIATIGAPGAPPVGIAFAWPGSDAVAMPASLIADDESTRTEFHKLLSSEAPAKLVFGAKELARFSGRAGVVARGLHFDAKLAFALLDPDRAGTDLDGVALAYGAPPVTPYDASAAPMELFAAGHGMSAAHASAAAAIVAVTEPLQDDLRNAGMSGVFDDVEMPLAPVLAQMESAGFRLDLNELDRMRRMLDDAIANATASVHQLAGEEFNINSPKALGVILFEKLKLPGGSKKKTAWATGVEVLAPLAAEHEIAARVLEFREVSKLKSTYVDALPALIDRDSILHTTFNQLGAATGRLSSTNPNLQNIPVRSEIGREIRRAFLPPTPGRVLLAADYSQIELRLFAHMSDDKTLIEAFKSGEDIHAYTARIVFAVRAGEAVPAELRRRAKAVNFGILYGMGSVGLAQSVGFSRGEARDFIAAYFARFPQVKQYIADSVAKARVDGFVTTMLGRRRLLPDLKSPHPVMRAAAERIAINAPLQGSAADLIKLAMVRIAQRINEEHLPAQLLLQVHDELIFEVDPIALDGMREDVRRAMEDAMSLNVPLVVDFKSGPSWGDMV
jgi:DNA polymerase I